MQRTGLIRTAITLLAVLAAVPFAGCNTLLDNRPGDLESPVSQGDPTEPGPAASGAGSDAGPRGRGDMGDATPDAPLAEPGTVDCAVGEKLCGGACVSAEDPAYGCAGPTCEPCAVPHAASACVNGMCAIASCEAGWGDCNASAGGDDGCETDLSAPTSCGSCGAACAATRPHTTAACVASACTLACEPGFGDCNGNPADGCEKDLLTDKHHCGQCGRLCLIGHCEAGTCIWKP